MQHLEVSGAVRHIYIYIYLYTGCNRRNGPNFRRVFLRSNYTDITQNTYIQISMVTGILAREKCGLLWCLRTVRCPWRHTRRIRLTFNGSHTVALRSIQQWVDYIWGANIRFAFVIARQWFGYVICIMFTDIAMVMQVLPWTNTDAITPKG